MLRTGLPLELSYYRGAHHSAVSDYVNLTALFLLISLLFVIVMSAFPSAMLKC